MVSWGTQIVGEGKCVYIYLFIWLCYVLVAAWELSLVACGIWFPDQVFKPGSTALGAQSLSHWTTREDPENSYL